jgi:dTDP-4-amino-4,6-dideoxygalactose transaminase
MSEILAAFLYAQLEAAARIQERRREVWETYRSGLADWAAERGYRLPIIPAHCEHSCHMFYVLLSCIDERQALIEHLRAHGILAVFHYVPLDRSEMARRNGFHKVECPVTAEVSDRLVRLPFYNGLSSADQQEIIELIRGFHSMQDD